MALYGITIFLSAFLLFLVQPLIGKYILPWYGGTPAVWTACMLFFQALLLGGYLYAHVLRARLSPRRQLIGHAALLVASLTVLPIIPAETWKPAGDQAPLPLILGLLLVTIGVPYFLLSSTTPLLQSWFSDESRPGSPYRLYSLANLGSLLALAAYPFILEPSVGLDLQARTWSYSYAAFVLMMLLVPARHRRRARPALSSGRQDLPAPTPPETSRGPGAGVRILWLGLAACGSVMLLATTNQLCLDVAVVPLLWVLPLSLYLLTFVISFHHQRWYSRAVFGPALAAALGGACAILFGGVYTDFRVQLAVYSCALFIACMVCHGELARLKPDPRHLTSYYLMIAAGGALGGFLVSFVAPQLLRGFWEYHFGLALSAFLFLAVLFRDRSSALCRGRLFWAWTGLYVCFLALIVTLAVHIDEAREDSVEARRNFFGVLRVLEQDKDSPGWHRYVLMHGRIEHGFQYLDPDKRYWPTSYFGPESGVGIAILFNPHRRTPGSGGSRLRIGVVGLGAGIIAAYGEEGDYIRFYEINPDVLRLSDRYFTYRRDCAARVDVVLGDARVNMEAELGAGSQGRFDVLVVDAFSSDAIPVHLLTRECFQTYFRHLKADGIIAVHISNRFFDISPVIRGIPDLPEARDMQALQVSNEGNDYQGTDASRWVLLTRNQAFLAAPEVQGNIVPWPPDEPRMQPWTDDYNNLFHLMR